MDTSGAAFYTAVVLLLVPLFGLAGLGVLFIKSLTTYNRPMISKDWPGLAGKGRLSRETRTAHIDGDFVVFIIGTVVHNWWDVRGWLPVFRSMSEMLKELTAQPECGFLGGQAYFGNPVLLVQYWRSFDHLHDYARAPSRKHFPAWVRMRKVMRENASFGIYHETYKVRAGEYETIYSNMYPFGLGAAVGTVPLKGRDSTARGRIGESKGDDHPATVPERPY